MVAVSVHVDNQDPVSLKLRKRKYTSATLLDALREKLGCDVEWNADCDVPLNQLHKDANGVVDLHVCSNNMCIDEDAERESFADGDAVVAQATVKLDGDVSMEPVAVDDPEPALMAHAEPEPKPELAPVLAACPSPPAPRMAMTRETWW